MIGLIGRISFAVLLAAMSIFLLVRPFLGDIEAAKKESFITEVTQKGPVVVDDLEWTLNSLRAYTQLVDEEKKRIPLDVPGGAVIVMAEFSIRPTEKTKIDGVICNAELRDDRGNRWEAENVFQLPLPTYCGDNDLVIERGKPFKVAKVFVVPKESVPHLVGIVVPPSDQTSAERRVLIKP